MLTRHAAGMAAHSQRASAIRRMRRRAASDPLYCRTNGCPTHLVLDAASGVATCPVCGYTRRLA